MSNIPSSVVAGLSKIARDVLERSRYARPGRHANVRAAVRFAATDLAGRVASECDPLRDDAGSKLRPNEIRRRQRIARALALHLGRTALERPAKERRRRPTRNEEEKRLEALGRLLRRLAYPAPGQTPSLQRDSYVTVRNLLNCLEAGAAQRCDELALSTELREAHRRMLRKKSWIALPDSLEYHALIPSAGLVSGCSDFPSPDRVSRFRPLPPAVLERIECFRQEQLERGHDPRRVELAINRFLAPFCAHGRTSGLEVGFHELSQADQRRVVRYGLALEKIWLGKLAAADRVLRVDDDLSGADVIDGLTAEDVAALAADDWERVAAEEAPMSTNGQKPQPSHSRANAR